tara:strand:- start:25 stop:2451 length:2427 start_codon:yes stop_codon:yes gene_type:complete
MNSDQREKYKKLFREGFYFDVAKERFYSNNIGSFKAPEGFENWEVEEFNEKKYYNDRVLQELGITEAENEVLLFKDAKKQGKKIKNKIFTTNKFGDIEIGLYNLDRVPFTFHQTVASHTNIVEKDDVIVRYTPWRTQIEGRKYHISGKTGTHPFLHPKLIEAYENEEEIKTLVITEGAFKAFKATHEGIYTIGLSSITHYRNNSDGEIHSDIIKIIKRCSVKNVVILWDGDCLDISTKALENEEDLIVRPSGFYAAAKKIRDGLKEFLPKKSKIFFAHIKSNYLSNGHPKGLDDLLVKYKDETVTIIEDFESIGECTSSFIKWLDITMNSKMKAFFNYFKLNNADLFYARHSKILTDKQFVLAGATYQFDYDKSELKTIVPRNARDYARIGTDYYYIAETPNKAGLLSEELLMWSKANIVMDHEKGFVDHIPKYKKFVNVPSHDRYQKIIAGCYNKYYDVDIATEQGNWKNIELFLKHIFEEHYLYALDYIQLLYTNPQQPLPILCLASKENETGKSTFINLLKWIFQKNMAIIGNAELESEFNSGWITKLIIASEETFLDKKATMEKIKSLSTADSISMNAKGKDLVEIDFFGKFVFATNNEETFIKISKEDKRYWIRKVKTIPKENRDEAIKGKMQEEIPAFIHYLQDRKMHVEKTQGRMWFDTEKLRTDLFYKVAKQSSPVVEKEIRDSLIEMFTEFNVQEIKMSLKDIQEEFGVEKYERSYIKRVILENLNGVYYSKSIRYSFPKWSFDYMDIDLQKKTGRPFIFKRSDFEIEEIENEVLDVINNRNALNNLQPEESEDLPFNK